MAMQEAVFLCTRVPRRALPLMMQYGTSFLRHRAGIQQTISTGSTSWAMMTSLASFCSMSVVTWLRPNFKITGFFGFTSPPSFFAFAASNKRADFSFLVSGLYFWHSLSKLPAWFLSMVFVNWLTAGGTFKRKSIMRFLRCKRMYFGHFTKRLRSVFGRMSPPIRKFFGFFSKRTLFCTFFFFFSPRGAAGVFFLGCAFVAACLPMAAQRARDAARDKDLRPMA
mmetsp:Transcript_47819/g.111530  ORF Transcript_47819/g.111530 Transcript_47819/m.111530 type:complete len:224 (-) Transcript_47819:12-683(-)